MKFKLITTPQEYDQAVRLLEEIGDRDDFQENEELIDQFDLLAKLISIYEEEQFPISVGDPIEIIKLKMSYMGLKRKDLEHIATSGVLSEVFNKKRGLSKTMIREFSILLNIEQSLLNPALQSEATLAKSISRVRAMPKFAFIKNQDTEIELFKQRTLKTHMLFNLYIGAQA